jgi:hypothetical protein
LSVLSNDGGYQIFANEDNHYSIVTTAGTTIINNLFLSIEPLATKEVLLNDSTDNITTNADGNYMFNLAESGSNVITISVLAEDGSTSTTYYLEVV